MSAYFLDSSVIIDVLTGRRNRKALLKQLLIEGHLLACCAINITEVYAGMRPQEKRQTDELLLSFDYVEITREIAAMAGRLKREYSVKGITLSVSDVTIAAVVLSSDLPLLTDNSKHYPMPGIRLFPLPG